MLTGQDCCPCTPPGAEAVGACGSVVMVFELSLDAMSMDGCGRLLAGAVAIRAYGFGLFEQSESGVGRECTARECKRRSVLHATTRFVLSRVKSR